MIQKIKALFAALLISGTLFAPALVPATVYADFNSSKNAACEGISLSGSSCDSSAGGKVGSLLSTLVNLLSVIVGVVAVVMIIIAGFKYVTSGGESNNITAAKNTLIYAIVGLIIVALAQFIVKFVLEQV